MSAPTSTVDHSVPEDAQPDPDVPTGTGRSHRRTLVLTFPVTLLAALVCTGILETPLWWDYRSHVPALLVVLDRPIDVLVVWLVLLFVVALTNRLWLSIGVVLLLASLLSAISNAKMAILTEPVFPNDAQFLNSPGFLLSMVSPAKVVLGLVAIPVVLALFVFIGRRVGRRYPRVTRGADRRLWNRLLVARLLAVALVGGALANATQFNEPGNPWRALYDAQGIAWRPFSQSLNYQANGFVGGLLYNMPTEAMRVPQDYSAATMSELAARYTTRAAERNQGRTAGALDDVNVILVLSESFADPGAFTGLQLERDPIPLIRQSIAGAWGGSTLANYYGTGTSSMEFQALTGQTVALFNPQVMAPYQNFMTDLDSYPSAVGWFHEHGHRAIALHPFTTEMYRRTTIYPMLGFDDFVFQAKMREQRKVEQNPFISDYAAFAEVQRMMAENDEPILVNLVTMQNHLPMDGVYSSPVGVRGDASIDEKIQIGGFARGLEYSDAALDEFLTSLQAPSAEETVVVYYGDHYPGIFGKSLLDQNPGLDQLETPLLIWSNRDQEPRPLPVTSANQFMPYVFDLAGEPLPPYYELLEEVAEELGALSPGRIVSPDGTEVDRDDLTEEQEQLLHDYELVQYDFSIGERYAVDEMWYDFE